MKKFEGQSVAVDIDSTLSIGDYKYPELGEPNIPLIKSLNRFREEGGVVVINTLRETGSPLGDILTPALEFLKENGLEWDYVNDNIPERIRKWNDNPRKIAATYHIDDRNIDPLSFMRMTDLQDKHV